MNVHSRLYIDGAKSIPEPCISPPILPLCSAAHTHTQHQHIGGKMEQWWWCCGGARRKKGTSSNGSFLTLSLSKAPIISLFLIADLSDSD